LPPSITSSITTFSLGTSTSSPTVEYPILTSTNPFCEIIGYEIHAYPIVDGTYHPSFIKAVRWVPNKNTATSFYWDI